MALSATVNDRRNQLLTHPPLEEYLWNLKPTCIANTQFFSI